MALLLVTFVRSDLSLEFRSEDLVCFPGTGTSGFVSDGRRLNVAQGGKMRDIYLCRCFASFNRLTASIQLVTASTL